MSHLAGDRSVALVVVSGLPAVGRTTIAGVLAQQIRAAHVRIDPIEQALIEATPLVQPLNPVDHLVGYAVAAYAGPRRERRPSLAWCCRPGNRSLIAPTNRGITRR